MKFKKLVHVLAISLSSLAFSSVAVALPLTATTAVQTKPESGAPPLSFLKAGTEPVAATSFKGTLPMGWMAVELPGPFEGYVTNNDITKNLDIIPGTAIHLEPKADSAVLTTMEKNDRAEISGMPRGKWMQIKLEKKITGFINLSPAGSMNAPAIQPVASMTPSPAAVTSAGHAVAATAQGDGGSSALPRVFQGKIVSTKRPLAPRRKYDFQLNDESGIRVAYVDVSRLLLTEQIEKYIDRTVVLYGTAKNDVEAKGMVIHAESLQLK